MEDRWGLILFLGFLAFSLCVGVRDAGRVNTPTAKVIGFDFSTFTDSAAKP